MNWVKAFGDEVETLDVLTDEQKKEYIGGLVKRIDVRYESDNREHELTLTMHLPIVNDGIKVVRDGQQAREYEVTPGTDTVSLVSKKKRRSRVTIYDYENYSLPEPVCHRGVIDFRA